MKKFRKYIRHNALPFIMIAFIVFIYFLLNFRYVQQLFDWDQIVYSNNIIRGLKRGSYLFNPHHLHFEITGGMFHEFIEGRWGEAGFTDIIFNLRLRSLFTACLGLFFAFFFIRNVTGKLTWATLGVLLIALSHGYLSYATKVDTPIFPAVGFISLIWFVERASRNYRFPWLMGMLGGSIIFISVMFHQYMLVAGGLVCMVLVIPPWLFPFGKNRDSISIQSGTDKLMYTEPKPIRRYILSIFTGLFGISLVVAAYYHIGVGIYEFPVSNINEANSENPYEDMDFQLWLFALETVEGWGTGFKEFHPEYSFHGFTVSFLAPESIYSTFTYNEDADRYQLAEELTSQNFAYNHIGYLTFVFLFLAILLLPGLYRRYGRSFLFVFLNFIFYSIFTTYWEAHYFEFWLIPNISFWILLVMMFNLVGETISTIWKSRGFWKSKSLSSKDIGYITPQHGLNGAQLPGYGYIILIIFILFAHNYTYHLQKYCKEPRSIGIIWADWEESYYEDLYSSDIYNDPDNPYGK